MIDWKPGYKDAVGNAGADTLAGGNLTEKTPAMNGDCYMESSKICQMKEKLTGERKKL